VPRRETLVEKRLGVTMSHAFCTNPNIVERAMSVSTAVLYLIISDVARATCRMLKKAVQQGRSE
jgi:uncharacterized integral membrane protein